MAEFVIAIIHEVATNGASIVGFVAFLCVVGWFLWKLQPILARQNEIIESNTRAIMATAEVVEAAADVMRRVSEQFSGHDERSKLLLERTNIIEKRLREIEMNGANREELKGVYERINDMHKDVCEINGAIGRK